MPGDERLRQAYDRLRQVYDRLPAMAGYWDADLRNVLANQAYLEWFGLSPDQIRGRHFRDVLGDELYALNEPLALAALRGELQTFDRMIVDASGHVRHTQSTYIPDIDDAQVRGFQVLITDITARTAAESARADESELLRTILNTVTDGVICLDHELRITDLNAAASTMTGWTLGAAADRVVDEVVQVSDHARAVAVRPLCQEVLHSQIQLTRLDTDQLHHRHSGPLGIDWSITPLRSSSGELRGVVLTLRDTHGSRQRLREAELRAEHDPLTGLKNRSYLARVARLSQPADQAVSAVLFLDLDGFKRVNDTAGHGAGDAVLREVASVISGAVRCSDEVVRMGGDEFAVLLHGCRLADAAEVARQIVARVDTHAFRWRGQSFRLGVSAGVAPTGTGQPNPLDAALEAADEACYRAKRSGGHRSVLTGGGAAAPG
jgi:diguanylate cyclase